MARGRPASPFLAGKAGRDNAEPDPAPPVSSLFSSPTYFSPPSSGDAGLPSPGGDWLGNELQRCRDQNPFRSGIHRGPTRKLDGSLELNLVI